MPDATLTPYQADFLLDWLEADPDDAMTACEVVNPNGKTVYEEAGAADAQTFLDDLTTALTSMASTVDDEEETAA